VGRDRLELAPTVVGGLSRLYNYRVFRFCPVGCIMSLDFLLWVYREETITRNRKLAAGSRVLWFFRYDSGTCGRTRSGDSS